MAHILKIYTCTNFHWNGPKLANCDRDSLHPQGIRPAIMDPKIFSKVRGLRHGQGVYFEGFGCTTPYPPGGSCLPSTHLKWGFAPVTDRKICGQSDGTSSNPRRIICLDGEDITACIGDSGGPIMVESKDPVTEESRMVLAGIISSVQGETSCQKGANIIVASIETHRGWISKHISAVLTTDLFRNCIALPRPALDD